jgi:hypothetical protein
VSQKPVWIAAGVTLVAEPSGRLPVRIRWVKEMGVPEGLAVDGDVLYVADEIARALYLADGSVKWETGNPTQDGLESDGYVAIGLSGPDRVRLWSPYNFDLFVDRESGRFVSLRGAGEADPPAGKTPFPARAARYRLGDDLKQSVARDKSGAVAFEIRVDEPWFDPIGPMAVPGGLALVTSSGHLVVMDYL